MRSVLRSVTRTRARDGGNVARQDSVCQGMVIRMPYCGCGLVYVRLCHIAAATPHNPLQHSVPHCTSDTPHDCITAHRIATPYKKVQTGAAHSKDLVHGLAGEADGARRAGQVRNAERHLSDAARAHARAHVKRAHAPTRALLLHTLKAVALHSARPRKPGSEPIAHIR